MEPSFWSWEKQAPTTSPTCISGLPQWSPAFGAGKSRNHRQPHLVHPAAMEPSFWSWEKWSRHTSTATDQPCRNGAQLLELGKAIEVQTYFVQDPRPQWSPAFGAGKRSRSMPFLRVTEMAAMEPSFWSWEKGRSILVHGKGGHAAMEPSFWSWEKSPASAVSNTDSSRRNGAQLLELGKAELATYLAKLQSQAAMEPSFWSWEKAARGISRSRSRWAAMEPSFWSWEKGQPPHLTSKPCLRAAMEPSFWSWEKPTSSRGSSRGCAMPQWSPAFGAGKSYNVNAEVERVLLPQWSPAFGAGKSGSNSPLWSRKTRPQWSPAFGAGKRARDFFTN